MDAFRCGAEAGFIALVKGNCSTDKEVLHHCALLKANSSEKNLIEV